jgi:Uma2 family endonuclease
MQLAEKRKLTYADYAQLPEGAPYQLIDGELVMSPAPTPYHQRISIRLGYALMGFVREQHLGEVLMAPVDVYLGEVHTFQPDLLYLAQERLSRIGEQRIEGAPDLVIEILSPATAYYDLKVKAHVYAETGVREYWVVDPVEKSIEVYENGGGHFDLIMRADGAGAVASNLLDGFTVALADVF